MSARHSVTDVITHGFPRGNGAGSLAGHPLTQRAVSRRYRVGIAAVRATAWQAPSPARVHAHLCGLHRARSPAVGIVTVTEARALWTLDHESAVYAEWRAMQRLDDQTRRRAAVTRQAEAERRAAFEKAVLGR